MNFLMVKGAQWAKFDQKVTKNSRFVKVDIDKNLEKRKVLCHPSYMRGDGMKNVLFLSASDSRIDEECQLALPDHPTVARYIANQLRSHRGSVVLARIMCTSLLDFIERGDCPDRVPALDVYQDSGSYAELCRVMRGHDPEFTKRSGLFGWVLRGALECWSDPVTGTLMHRPMQAVSGDERLRTTYMKLFNCAAAMLASVPTDSIQAARAA